MGLADGVPVHFLSAATAGAMATVVGNPIDVVKTRVMASKRVADAGAAAGAPQYRGAWDCIVKTMRHEGPAAFYQGVVPQFFRITGWNIVMFVSLEQLRRAASQVLA
jgi:solute carrier family 25 (mitochondrial uncoupling protein), member 8/9